MKNYAIHKESGELLLVLRDNAGMSFDGRVAVDVQRLTDDGKLFCDGVPVFQAMLLEDIIILPEKLLARLERSLSFAKRQFFFSMHDHLYKDELFDKRPHWDDVRDGLLALMKQLERGLCDWCMMPVKNNECTSCGRQQEVTDDD